MNVINKFMMRPPASRTHDHVFISLKTIEMDQKKKMEKKKKSINKRKTQVATKLLKDCMFLADYNKSLVFAF